MTSQQRGAFAGRRAAAVVFGLFVVVGLVIVFGGTLARSTDIEAAAERKRAEIAVLEARVAAGEAEIEFYGTEAFLRWQARVHGLGESGEKLIERPANAPSPEPIVPLGASGTDSGALAPFDAWMELLFGG